MCPISIRPAIYSALMIIKKIFIVVLNNTPESITKQQRYLEKCLEKDRRYHKKSKDRLQKLACN